MDASVNRIRSSVNERALLIAVHERSARTGYDDSLEELKLLVKTAGAMLVDSLVIKRDKLDPAWLIGSGYVAQLKSLVAEKKIRLVVFDMNNLKPAQVRNLEEALGCRVVGRTEIILDIFARRARSNEAKIQVELAQLRYILPRLKGLGGVLSRLGGGIGTRGPGEKMLETDRRHILARISRLKQKLKQIVKHREQLRQSRAGEICGVVVGYTNAGKSTLINNLAKDDLFVEDRLFATLDSYTRRVYLSDALTVLLTDTVGFIRNLPANLVESFKSTLEEITHADFVIHVVDISAVDVATTIATVEKELIALEAMEKPLILFFNKVDRMTEQSAVALVETRYPEAVIGSAQDSTGIDRLRDRIIGIADGLRHTSRG